MSTDARSSAAGRTRVTSIRGAAPSLRATFRGVFALLSLGAAGGIIVAACGFDGAALDDPLFPQQDTGPPIEASTIARPDGSGVDLDAGLNAEVAAPPGCPIVTGGPAMVRAGDAGFCIDRTEVTNAQYDQFLAATGGGKVDGGFDGGLPARCAGLLTYGRSTLAPLDGSAVARPVVSITWCAASAFCAWSGKRLCAGPTAAATKGLDGGEWQAACSDFGARPYAFGADAAIGACNYGGVAGDVEPVGFRPGCEGGIDGLSDMTGNAREWIDECSGGAGGNCFAQGADFTTALPAATCSERTAYPAAAVAAADVTGFRCCADLR